MKRKKLHCDQNELNELQTIRRKISQILSFNKTIQMNRSGIARLSRSWNESALFSTSLIQIGFKHLSLRLSSKQKVSKMPNPHQHVIRARYLLIWYAFAGDTSSSSHVDTGTESRPFGVIFSDAVAAP